MVRRTTRTVKLLLGALCGALLIYVPVEAQELQSTNYKLVEGNVGTGGLVQSSSNNFVANDATGDIGVGVSNSANYQLAAGSKTPIDPNLSFILNSPTISFPPFSPSTASVTTASFSILNYTSFGYVVQVSGTSPTNGSHVIPAMASTGPSQVGVEQFGLNLVANTSPANIGANPNNGGFGFGEAAPNYATPNQFRFVNGETIALAPKSSGVTTYTISYLVNVAGLTAGGQYKTDQTLIIVGTY